MTVSMSLNAIGKSTGRTQESLDASCIAWIWCASVGEIIVYMALVCKLWRVEKVCQFRKGQKILVKHVIWPFIVVVLVAIGVLVAWTVASPPYFKQGTTTGLDGELYSVGICYFKDGGTYQLVLTIIFVFSISVALWLSLKTRKLPEALSDSRRVWQTLIVNLILGMILFVINLIFVAVPLSSASASDNATSSNSSSTSVPVNSLHTGIYLSNVFYQFFAAMTSIGFLVIPKIYYVRYEQIHGNLPAGVHKIGGRVTVMIDTVPVDVEDLSPSHNVTPVITQRSTEQAGSPTIKITRTDSTVVVVSEEQCLGKKDQYDDHDHDHDEDGSQNFRMDISVESSISDDDDDDDDDDDNDKDVVENNV